MLTLPSKPKFALSRPFSWQCSLSLPHKLISYTIEMHSNPSHAYCYRKKKKHLKYRVRSDSSWLGCIDILVIHTYTITQLTVVPAPSAFEEPTENLKSCIIMSRTLRG